ncbi:GNAT family N-acetyltransferase [Albimonas sp. CAU 1670]|uniref:GNAT family N-acetyltransferase n=1 Tax=Albimonas sp. CAU 1670 TaxID=3032599 RepID=UPI0023DB5ACF|nr:GNAT family N-acetyltransferase [Albimonas sp. CAU 1670]MDF2231087.1 GNAT family N-acetyltransferase [Albimonas sp. CAU 1670]
MIVVRRATPDDGPAMAAVLNPIILRGGSTAYEEELAPAYLAGKATKPAFAHVALDETGRVIGFQWIEPDARDPALAIIASFVALDAAQGGVGSALFPHTRAEATRRGYREIDATIRADNAGGLAYYARQGFVDFEVHRAVPLKDGTPVDRISKRLALRGA